MDQCIDLSADDAPRRLDRYGQYAFRSGVAADTVTKAKAAIGSSATMVPDWRDGALLDQAGFGDAEPFYAGMARRGWVAYA